jgi:hypothetical protein
MVLLTREKFRETCLKRDGHKCAICGNKNDLVVHHIIERRLFDDYGYYENNGISVCPSCHIKCEQTLISVEEARKAAGIIDKCIPNAFYIDEVIDKFGNCILPNGMRMRGPLFDDASVHKILEPVLHLFTKYVKYPKTPHLPHSPGIKEDDRVLPDDSCFHGQEVVVSVKHDGENCLDGLSFIETDRGKLTIQEICEKEIKCKVLSFNDIKEKEEYKNINGYFISESNEETEWYEIEIEDGAKLKLTGNHLVFLPELNCYRKVSELNGNEKILLKK